ncbi:hypothetical protein CEXT_421391 [Caerostris extrusa]|uniref:Uncharacterized protein n=1 Tax=Caerostris extrusa TaxID=172846 RepID=A0AAV4W2H3_CAEEX|nr:hypothetical protein CEXT_421391 [Caerostris extrusa]
MTNISESSVFFSFQADFGSGIRSSVLELFVLEHFVKRKDYVPSNYNPPGPPGETHQWRSHYFSPGEETTEVGNKFTDRAVTSVTFTDNRVHSCPDAIVLSTHTLLTGSDVGAPRCVLQAHKKKTGFQCCHE